MSIMEHLTRKMLNGLVESKYWTYLVQVPRHMTLNNECVAPYMQNETK